MQPLMTKEIFLQRWAAANKSSIAEVLKHHEPIACHCEDPQCVGWAMVSVHDAIVLDLDEARRFVITLRRVLSSRNAPSAFGMVDRAMLSELLQRLELQASPREGVTLTRVGGELGGEAAPLEIADGNGTTKMPADLAGILFKETP